MDKRVKFSSKIKLQTVHAVISGHESCLSAARKIGANKGTVQRWVMFMKNAAKMGLV